MAIATCAAKVDCSKLLTKLLPVVVVHTLDVNQQPLNCSPLRIGKLVFDLEPQPNQRGTDLNAA